MGSSRSKSSDKLSRELTFAIQLPFKKSSQPLDLRIYWWPPFTPAIRLLKERSIMRIIVFLLLLIPVILLKAGQQQRADGPPDLEVGEVSSSKFRTYDSVDSSGRQRL